MARNIFYARARNSGDYAIFRASEPSPGFPSFFEPLPDVSEEEMESDERLHELDIADAMRCFEDSDTTVTAHPTRKGVIVIETSQSFLKTRKDLRLGATENPVMRQTLSTPERYDGLQRRDSAEERFDTGQVIPSYAEIDAKYAELATLLRRAEDLVDSMVDFTIPLDRCQCVFSASPGNPLSEEVHEIVSRMYSRV